MDCGRAIGFPSVLMDKDRQHSSEIPMALQRLPRERGKGGRDGAGRKRGGERWRGKKGGR